MRIMLELKAFMEKLLSGNPNEDHEDFENQNLGMGQLVPRMIFQYKPWRWATLPKGDFENYLQNGDMVKVTRRFDKNDDV
jgi:hypothetical protein